MKNPKQHFREKVTFELGLEDSVKHIEKSLFHSLGFHVWINRSILGNYNYLCPETISLVVKEEGSGERRLIFNKQIKKDLIRSSNLTMKTMKNSKGI